MVNLILMVISFGFWFTIFWFSLEKPETKLEKIKRSVVVLVLVIPFNINGNIFTVLGSAQSDKSIYSIFSIYQEAKYTAFSLASLYQKTENHAFSLFGSFYQKAEDTGVLVGISGYQEAGSHAYVFFGINGHQVSEKESIIIIGVSGYQKAHKKAVSGIGLSIYREVDDTKPVWFALSSTQNPSYKK